MFILNLETKPLFCFRLISILILREWFQILLFNPILVLMDVYYKFSESLFILPSWISVSILVLMDVWICFITGSNFYNSSVPVKPLSILILMDSSQDIINFDKFQSLFNPCSKWMIYLYFLFRHSYSICPGFKIFNVIIFNPYSNGFRILMNGILF